MEFSFQEKFMFLFYGQGLKSTIRFFIPFRLTLQPPFTGRTFDVDSNVETVIWQNDQRIYNLCPNVFYPVFIIY